MTHEQIEVSKGGFKTKRSTTSTRQTEELRLNSDLEINGGDILLKHYLKDWLAEYKQGTVRKNTYILHERNVNTKILPYFKDIKLKDIKPLRYQKFINHLAEQGYSKRTIEIIHGTMFNALSTAVKPLKKLEENPCEGVTIPKIPKKKKNWRTLTQTTSPSSSKLQDRITIFTTFSLKLYLKLECVREKSRITKKGY